MTLTTEQQQWLTEEFLGLCQHEDFTNLEPSDFYEGTPICSNCGKIYGENAPIPNFTDWRTFGLLMNELDNRWSDEEIAKFLYALAIEGNPQTFPVRAANYIYDFFNGGSDDRARTY